MSTELKRIHIMMNVILPRINFKTDIKNFEYFFLTPEYSYYTCENFE